MKKKRASAAVLAGILALSMCLTACKSKKIKPVEPEDFENCVKSHGFTVTENDHETAEVNIFANYSDFGVSVMFNYYRYENEKDVDEHFDEFLKLTEKLAAKDGYEGEITKKDSYIYAKYEVSGSGVGRGQPDILVMRAEKMILICYTNMTDESNEIRKNVLNDLGINIEIKT